MAEATLPTVCVVPSPQLMRQELTVSSFSGGFERSERVYVAPSVTEDAPEIVGAGEAAVTDRVVVDLEGGMPLPWIVRPTVAEGVTLEMPALTRSAQETVGSGPIALRSVLPLIDQM